MTNNLDILSRELSKLFDLRAADGFKGLFGTWLGGPDSFVDAKARMRSEMRHIVYLIRMTDEVNFYLSVTVRGPLDVVYAFRCNVHGLSDFVSKAVNELPFEKRTLILYMPFKSNSDYWTIERAVAKRGPKIKDFCDSFSGIATCAAVMGACSPQSNGVR